MESTLGLEVRSLTAGNARKAQNIDTSKAAGLAQALKENGSSNRPASRCLIRDRRTSQSSAQLVTAQGIGVFGPSARQAI